jgi:hypothetical protein
VYERQSLTGMSCDELHPFPAPDDSDWIDSMEYGNSERQPVNGRLRMNDRDTTPTWRMIAANLWGTSCYDAHIAEVAADPILTTHVIAVSALAYPPEHADMITRLAFDQSGAGQVFGNVQSGGLKGARHVVNAMHLSTRKTAIGECVAHVLHGFTALRLDVGARFHD